MKGVNKAILVGALGNDPDIRYMPNGNAVANFSIATNETWKDKNTGQQQEKTTWHNIVIFGKLAEICGEYLRKGSQVYLEGKITTEKYQDKNTGEDKYSTKIVCNEMQMLGGKPQGQQNQQQGGFSQPQQQNQGYQQQPQAVQQNAHQRAMQSGGAPQAMAQNNNEPPL